MLPSTPMLDDFCRPDEAPLYFNGAWQPIDTIYAGTPNVTLRKAAADSGSNAARYWAYLPGLIDCEAYGTISTLGTGWIMLFLRMKDVGGSNAADGYLVTLSPTTLTCYSVTNGSASPIGIAAWSTATGDTLVARMVGPTLTCYVVRGSTVNQVVSCTNTLYTSGYIGLGISSITTRVANFGGGTIDSLEVSAPTGSNVGGRGSC